MSMLLSGARPETDERHELRRQVRRLLGKQWSEQHLLRFADGDIETGRQLLMTLDREMALSAMLIAEDHGGLGGGWTEVVITAEELGAAMAPSRLLGDVMAATLLQNAVGATSAALLERIASSGSRASVVWPGSDGTWDFRQVESAVVEGGRVSGTFRSVPEVDGSDVLLLPATDEARSGVAVVVKAEESTGLETTSVRSPDVLRPIVNVAAVGVPQTYEALADSYLSFAKTVAAGAIVLAAEMVGGARACLERTAGYTEQRQQFGRPIATFQAVKHRLVDILVAWEAARAITYRAADRFDHADPNGSDLEECLSLVRMAKAAASDALHLASRQSVQLHGGIGFTWENGSHFFLRRYVTSSSLYGQPDDLRSQVYEALVAPIQI